MEGVKVRRNMGSKGGRRNQYEDDGTPAHSLSWLHLGQRKVKRGNEIPRGLLTAPVHQEEMIQNRSVKEGNQEYRDRDQTDTV